LIEAWHGQAGQGPARPGKAWQGKGCFQRPAFGLAGANSAKRGKAGHGKA